MDVRPGLRRSDSGKRPFGLIISRAPGSDDRRLFREESLTIDLKARLSPTHKL